MTMNRLAKSGQRFLTGMMLMSFTLGSVLPFPAQGQSSSRNRTVSLSSGTVIPIKLDEAINSKDANKGDTFTATVTTLDSGDEATALPVGTKVTGVVRSVQAMEGKNPGTLDLDFTRVTLPNGRSYSIAGSPVGLDSKSVTHKNGHLVAKNGQKGPSRLTYVGIGAGAGLLVNILTHRKGTLLDTLIGAGLGYGAGSLIKGGSSPKDVELGSGTKLGLKLDRSLAVAR